jgi:hypothetical protein
MLAGPLALIRVSDRFGGFASLIDVTTSLTPDSAALLADARRELARLPVILEAMLADLADALWRARSPAVARARCGRLASATRRSTRSRKAGCGCCASMRSGR